MSPGPGPALVDPEAKAVGLGLPSGAGLGGPALELDAEHALPEAERAIGVVGRKLDQRRGHAMLTGA